MPSGTSVRAPWRLTRSVAGDLQAGVGSRRMPPLAPERIERVSAPQGSAPWPVSRAPPSRKSGASDRRLCLGGRFAVLLGGDRDSPSGAMVGDCWGHVGGTRRPGPHTASGRHPPRTVRAPHVPVAAARAAEGDQRQKGGSARRARPAATAAGGVRAELVATDEPPHRRRASQRRRRNPGPGSTSLPPHAGGRAGPPHTQALACTWGGERRSAAEADV